MIQRKHLIMFSSVWCFKINNCKFLVIFKDILKNYSLGFFTQTGFCTKSKASLNTWQIKTFLLQVETLSQIKSWLQVIYLTLLSSFLPVQGTTKWKSLFGVLFGIRFGNRVHSCFPATYAFILKKGCRAWLDRYTCSRDDICSEMSN